MPQPKVHKDHAARQAAYRKRQEEARERVLRAKGIAPLPAIPTMPGTRRWDQIVANATQMLSGALDEMQDYFDERSETWQEGDRGEQHEERISAIQEVVRRA